MVLYIIYNREMFQYILSRGSILGGIIYHIIYYIISYFISYSTSYIISYHTSHIIYHLSYIISEILLQVFEGRGLLARPIIGNCSKFRLFWVQLDGQQYDEQKICLRWNQMQSIVEHYLIKSDLIYHNHIRRICYITIVNVNVWN